MTPAMPPVPPELPNVVDLRSMRSSSHNISRLSTRSAEHLARAIREIGWDDESIAAAAFIVNRVDLVHAARVQSITEIAKDDLVPFYSLLTFLGISEDDLAALGDDSTAQVA